MSRFIFFSDSPLPYKKYIYTTELRAIVIMTYSKVTDIKFWFQYLTPPSLKKSGYDTAPSLLVYI